MTTKTQKKTEDKKVVINEDLDKLMEQYKTKSAVIRYLNSQGHKRADIARFMGIIYQHVRNVLVQDAIKAEAEKS